MSQLVGRNCVRCGDRIPSELDARFCRACGSPVHDRCAVPADGVGCSGCGAGVEASRGNAPAERQPVTTQTAIDAVVAYVSARFRDGEAPETVRTELVQRGVSPETADQLVAVLKPGKWERGTRGQALRAFGVLVMVAGGFLILGNQIGFFPTFPFAGTITVFLGAAIYAVGGGKG